jgi:hypothetical protein
MTCDVAQLRKEVEKIAQDLLVDVSLEELAEAPAS